VISKQFLFENCTRYYDENICSLGVRVVSSEQPGMGKSLYIHRMAEKLRTITKHELADCQVIIPIHGPTVTRDVFLKFLKEHYQKSKCIIYHFDISPCVRFLVVVDCGIDCYR
jgi:hypothetical protein